MVATLTFRTACRSTIMGILAVTTGARSIMVVAASQEAFMATLMRGKLTRAAVMQAAGMGRPLVTEGPLGMERPLVTERPLGMERPLVTEGPLGMERPLVTERPLGMERPLVTEGPLGMEGPLVTERP